MLPARSTPLPALPEAWPLEAWPDPDPETDGGGGMTLEPPSAERCDREGEDPVPAPSEAMEGGGAITFEAPWERPEEFPLEPLVELPMEGGGGMTLALSE